MISPPLRSRDERPIGESLIAQDRYEAYLADKGFAGVRWERHWLESYRALLAATPKDNSRRRWSEADSRWAAGKRQIIEGVINQLSRTSSLWSATGPRPCRVSVGVHGGQDRSIHLRAAAQCPAGSSGAPLG